MNICIESYLLNHPRRSGVMTYTEGLVDGMNANDNDNYYTMLYYSLKRKPEEMPGPNGKRFKKVVLKVPDQLFWGRQFAIDKIFLPTFFKKYKIDIFHRPVGYTMPESKNVYKILTVHDLRTLTIKDQVFEQNIDQYKKTFSLVDHCVVVSECTKQDLMKHFDVNEKKITVTYLGADERYQRADQDKIDAVKEKFKLNKPFFLSVGSFPRKNIEGIIRGFSKCHHNDDYILVLNCKFDIDQYQQIGDSLGLKDKIVFVSTVSDDDLVSLYSACHCFVFPSHYEGFGLPIIEAMHCGAPVITSNVSACPEVAGDAAMLVDPNNTGQIGEAMDTMCQYATLRKSYIDKGYQRVKLFSWDKFAEGMKEVYSKA